MNQRLKRVMAEPLSTLRQYKSFLLLMFFVCVADRVMKLFKTAFHLNLKLPPFWRVDPELSGRMLFKFPGMVWKQVGIEHMLLAAAGLFLLKNMLRLWPSSDLRRMHRQERERFGILNSLAAVGWRSPAWYLLALFAWGASVAAWAAACYCFCRIGWRHLPGGGWVWGLGISTGLMVPWMLAGFSFASKLAVSTGGMIPKLNLLFKTITDWQVAWRAWLFYLAWAVLELLFITLTTAFILAEVTPGSLRIMVAIALATPFYAYLEMASFKLFLIVFEEYPTIRQEYVNSYGSLRS